MKPNTTVATQIKTFSGWIKSHPLCQNAKGKKPQKTPCKQTSDEPVTTVATQIKTFKTCSHMQTDTQRMLVGSYLWSRWWRKDWQSRRLRVWTLYSIRTRGYFTLAIPRWSLWRSVSLVMVKHTAGNKTIPTNPLLPQLSQCCPHWPKTNPNNPVLSSLKENHPHKSTTVLTNPILSSLTQN